MFRSRSRRYDRKREGKVPVKYRFDVLCHDLQGLPSKSVKQCRVVVSRGQDVQMTRLAMVANGVAKFDQMLSQEATVYKATQNTLEPKVCNLKIQSPGRGSDSRMLTIARATVDMARYASLHANKPDILEVPITFEFGRGHHPNGVLRISITGTLLRGLMPDDAMTEASLSAISTASHQMISEQDLAGFEASDMAFEKTSPNYRMERSSTDQYDRSPSFQTEPDRPLTPNGQQQKPNLVSVPSTTSNTSMAAQTAESCSIISRRSPDSDFFSDFEKLATEVNDLKESLAKAQAEKDELRTACQTAVEHEDELHAQLQELRQSKVNASCGDEEEEEEDAEVQYLRDQLHALEEERALWKEKMAEAEKWRLENEALKEKGTTKGATYESGSDWEFHVQSTDDAQCAFIPRMPNQTQVERDDLKRQLETKEKMIQSLEHQHEDVHNRLVELTNERDDLKGQLETVEKEVSELTQLRADIKALEEDLLEAKKTIAEPVRSQSDMQQLAEALDKSEEAIVSMVAPREVERALAAGLLSERKRLEQAEIERSALSAQLSEMKHGGDELVEVRKERDEIAKELSVRIQEATKAEEWAQETQRALRASEDQLATAQSRVEELEAQKAKNDIDINRVVREKEFLLEDVAAAENKARELEHGLSEKEDSYNKMEKRLHDATTELCAAEVAVKRLERDLADAVAEGNQAAQKAARLESVCADLEADGKVASETSKKVGMLDEALAVMMTQKTDLEEKLSNSEAAKNKLRDTVSLLEGSLHEAKEKGKACERELKDLLAEAEQERELARQHLLEARDGYGAVEARLLETSHSLTASEAKLIEATEKLTATEGRVHEVFEEKSALESRFLAIDHRVQELEERAEANGARTKQLEEELAIAKSERQAAEQRAHELEGAKQELSVRVATLQEGLQEDHAVAVSNLEGKWSSRVTELEAENSDLHGRVASLDGSLVSAKNEVDRVTKSLGQRARRLEAEASEQVAKMGSLEAEREELGSRVQELEKQVFQLKLERDDAKENHADAVSELQRRRGPDALEVATKGQDIAKDLKAARAMVRELENEKQWLREQNQQLTEKMGETQFKVKDLEELVEEAEAEREELMEAASSAKAKLRDITKLEAALGKLQVEAKALRDENAMYHDDCQRLKDEAAATATRIQDNDSLRTELSRLRASTGRLTLEITDLKAQNVSLVTEADDLKVAAAAATLARSTNDTMERKMKHLREELDAQTAALEEATARAQSLSITNNKLEGVLALKLETLEDLEVARAKLQDGAPPKSRVARGLAIYEGGRGGNAGEAEVFKKQMASAQAKTEEAREHARHEAKEREVLIQEKESLERALKEMCEKNARLQDAAHTLLVKMERQYSGDHEPDISVEIDRMMQDLVESKMELAELKEECIVLRKELYKSRENGIQMAARVTRLEASQKAALSLSKAQTWTEVRLDDVGPETPRMEGPETRRSS